MQEKKKIVNGVNEVTNGNKFATLADMDDTEEVGHEVNIAIEGGVEPIANIPNLEREEHTEDGNITGMDGKDARPHMESITKAIHKHSSSNTSSLKAPIETRGRKNKGIVINEGMVGRLKKATSQSNNKICRHD